MHWTRGAIICVGRKRIYLKVAVFFATVAQIRYHHPAGGRSKTEAKPRRQLLVPIYPFDPRKEAPQIRFAFNGRL